MDITVFAFGDITSFWLAASAMLNVTVVVTVKLFVTWLSIGVIASVGLVGVVGLVHRGGGAGGMRNGPKFNVLGGVGRTALPFPFSLILLPLQIFEELIDVFKLPPMNVDTFSTSIDFRFCALNVLVLPKIPLRPLSTGDMVNTTLSTDSGLINCCPVLVKLLRLDVVSDGVPAWLNILRGVVGLNMAPTVVWLVVMIFCWCVLNTVVPMPLESDLVADEVCVGLGPLDAGFGFAIG